MNTKKIIESWPDWKRNYKLTKYSESNMTNKPNPDIYQDESFSTPQFVYNKKLKVVAQISVDDDGCLWVREATLKHDNWGEWVKSHQLNLILLK